MRKITIISIHIIIWSIVIIAPMYISLASKDLPANILTYYILEALFHPIVFYTFYSLVIPATLYRKGKALSTMMLYLITIAGLAVLKLGIIYSIDSIFSLDFTSHEIYSKKLATGTAVNMVFMIVFALLVRIAITWAGEKRKKTELELEGHKLEIELLKAQINPHFFFNTLNNIYSLVYKKSDDAPAAVMKLSEIMRYIIYDSKAQMVSVEKELEQLYNYIELERLRSKDPGFIEIETHGNFSGHVIPPMIFLSFAENAFKHAKRKVEYPGIKFNITAEDGKLKYSVSNYILNEPHNNHQGEGVGMQNTRRRLDLLYPKCHKLDIKKDSEKYEVRLTLYCKY